MDCSIDDIPLFRGGDPDVIESVMRESPGRWASYSKGDIIAMQGAPCRSLYLAMQGAPCRSLYLLCSGSVYARMVSDEGKEFTLDTLSAPEVLASSFVFSTQRIFPVTIIAGSDCDLWVFSRDCILKMIERDRTVLGNYLAVISDHSMFLSRRLSEFALQTLSSRIVSYIRENGPVDNLQQTAFILGVARPSLSRAVSQLVGQGVLEKSDDGYRLTE